VKVYINAEVPGHNGWKCDFRPAARSSIVEYNE